MNKTILLLGATIGGVIGAYVPALWGDTNMFSIWSIILSTVFGIIGIIVAVKLSQRYDL